MKYELRRLSFGETLGQAFNLYFDNFVALFMIALVCNIPSILLIHVTGMWGVSEPSAGMALSFLLLLILSLVMTTLCTALTIEVISKRYLKEHQGIGQYIRNIMPFIFPVIGLAILQGIIVGFGILLLIVPGIYWALGLSVAAQVLIVERQRVGAAMKRSFALTKGKKWEIFGFWLILVLINMGVRQVMNLIATMMGQMDMLVETKLTIFYSIAHLLDILVFPISSCVFILIYFNLKIEQEGFDLEHLVDQFGSGEAISPGDTGPGPEGTRWQ